MSGYCKYPYMGLSCAPMTPPINLYEIVMACLATKSIPQRTVAAGSGVPFSTVCKIAQGCVKEPSVHSIQRLYDYFRRAMPHEQMMQIVQAVGIGADQVSVHGVVSVPPPTLNVGAGLQENSGVNTPFASESGNREAA